MKIKVQIDSVFQEETLQIQAPSRTPKIQQVVEFVESLDDNHRLKGKRMAKLISSSLMLFPEFTSKIVKF
jgi:pantothenate kinase